MNSIARLTSIAQNGSTRCMQTRCSRHRHVFSGRKASVPYNTLISCNIHVLSKHPSAAMENSLLGLMLSILCASLGSYWINQRRFKVPPGPPTMPLIGNLMHMPSELAYVTFNEWARKYSTYDYFLPISKYRSNDEQTRTYCL